MKKQIGLSIIAFFLGIGCLIAQGQGGPRMSLAERIKSVHEKLADFKLDPDKLAKTDNIFIVYYNAIQKQRGEMRASGGETDKDAGREKMLKLNADRDEQLKLIFTDDQFKKWKNDIESSMRPRRQNRPQ